MDAPLTSDNWDLVSASAIPWSDENACPREITLTEMDQIKAQFVAAAAMAARSGFDMIELHAAHGYLFIFFHFPVFQHQNRRIWRILGKQTALAVGSLCRDAC